MPSVLILGAASDIAAAIARKFAGQNYDIILAGRDSGRFEPLQSDIHIRYGMACSIYEFDALNYESHRLFFDSMMIKPLVSIAVFGMMEREETAFNDFALTERMINTNFTGAVSILNIIGRYYKENRQGTIVGISSVAGERGRQSKLIYASAKAALSVYLDGLRNVLYKENVHVVTVKPGFVYTKMTENRSVPAALTAKPEELADAVYDAVLKKKNTIYVKWFWRYIMLVIKNIPEFQFKKMNL